MQLITVFGNRKIYASIQEPAVSYLFNNFKKSSRTKTTRKKKKTLWGMPVRKKVKPENVFFSILWFWSCLVPRPMFDLTIIKYKTKIEFNWFIEPFFLIRKRYCQWCPLIHTFSVNKTHFREECKVRFLFHLD